MNPGRSRVRGLAGLTISAVLVLAGCSESTDEPGATPTSGSSSSTTPPVTGLPVPDGVELTAPGSELEVGERAVVAYEPRQGVVGVLDLEVTRLEKTTFKKSFAGWKLGQMKKANPYFVRVKVKNVGDTDLGGRRVPLYIVDGTNTLVDSSTFASRFDPCPSKPLPAAFKPGDKAEVCLVYLAPDHGDLTAVSFRPTQEFDPITWTGELKKPKPDKPKKGKGKRGGNRDGKGSGGR